MNKQEQLAEQIAKAEELLYKHVAGDTGLFNNEVYCNFDKAAAAIVEAMDAPAKEGMKWVKASERLPEHGKQVFWNRHEEPPAFGKYSQCGNSHYLVTIDCSGEEEAELLNQDWEWLDESAPAKEAISVPAQQPSLEEKKEDLVLSDINSSSVPCVTPLYNNNSIQQ
jgi:hypothetical protein